MRIDFFLHLIFLWALSSTLSAATLTVAVTNPLGEPLQNAVVALQSDLAPAPSSGQIATVDQFGMQFRPQVSSVSAGTAVEFRNSDSIQHNVYSFSKPRRFELKLFSGRPNKAIKFDTQGLVVLGCNIHDAMLSYIYVSKTPHHGVSAANGTVSLEGIASGEYQLYVWHPGIAENKALLQSLRIENDVDYAVTLNDASPSLKIKTGDTILQNVQ